MLKRLLSWFIKDYARASAKIRSAFDGIKDDLVKLNDSMEKKAVSNATKIAELQAHNASMETTKQVNLETIKNLNALMGVGSESVTVNIQK